MYNKNLWKPIFSGTLALTMALSPAVMGRSVSAEEPEGTMTEVSSEAVTTEDVTNASTDIPLTANYFPDAYFRDYLSENVDEDNNGTLSQAEREACTEIDIGAHDDIKGNCKNVSGIEYFTNLTYLDCCNNQISSLDVSKNVNLTCLRCEFNQLQTIDVNNNTELSELYCYNNQLTGLSVSKDKKLTVLDCSENPTLKSINVTNNPMLTTLYCDTTEITSLNISKNTELKFLACAYNKLTSLDLGKQTKLIFLKCEDNQIRTLDVSKNTQLQTLLCYYNQFAYIDLSKNTCISEFKAYGNVYTVTTNSKHQIDLTTIPGFQVSKVSNVSGGRIAGSILTFNNGVDVVSYTYDCGNGLSDTFTIKEAGSLTPTEEFCTRLYTLCLGRSAEQSGITYWSEQLNSKKLTGAQIGYNFVFSDEYKKKNTSDEAYVKMLYKVFMDREADQGGLKYWLDLLNQGMSREYVYKGFAESKEFTNICASYGIERGSVKLTQARDQNVNLTKFVNRIYVKAMNRKGDASGLNHWCNQILTKKMTPVQVAESFIYSKEFTDKNLSNTEYIKVLYRTFMGREADSAGLNYWLGRLNKGDSRKTVLKAFAGCQEFKNIVKSFGL